MNGYEVVQSDEVQMKLDEGFNTVESLVALIVEADRLMLVEWCESYEADVTLERLAWMVEADYAERCRSWVEARKPEWGEACAREIGADAAWRKLGKLKRSDLSDVEAADATKVLQVLVKRGYVEVVS